MSAAIFWAFPAAANVCAFPAACWLDFEESSCGEQAQCSNKRDKGARIRMYGLEGRRCGRSEITRLRRPGEGQGVSARHEKI